MHKGFDAARHVSSPTSPTALHESTAEHEAFVSFTWAGRNICADHGIYRRTNARNAILDALREEAPSMAIRQPLRRDLMSRSHQTVSGMLLNRALTY